MTTLAPRTVPMQVLVLSLSRTATRSMYTALTVLLKEHVYHGFEMMEDRPPGRFWLNAVENKYDRGTTLTRDDFDDALGTYAATTDMPCVFFWKELMDAYPEAKVVYVNRDFEDWWPSFRAAAIGELFNPLTWLVVQLEPVMGTYTATMSRRIVLEYFGANKPTDISKERAREVFERHRAEIREACKDTPGRLLEMRVQEGWEPLCKFLGKDVPNEPFPNVNDTAEQHKLTKAHARKKLAEGVAMLTTHVAPVFIAGVAAWWYYS